MVTVSRPLSSSLGHVMKSVLPLLVIQIAFLVSTIHASELIYERAPTEFVENGEAISLEIIIFKPHGPGPFPTLMFNHGSTGSDANPAYFKTSYTAISLAFYFNERGWLVAFPQRRGRGRSDGVYDEGLEPNGPGYSCNPEISLRGLERALQDLDSAVKYLKSRPDVDSKLMLIGGQSRGGILSIAYAGTRPEHFNAAINFVGGWIGERCSEIEEINTVTFKRGAGFNKPTLWLYGENDSCNSLTHSRKNFDVFIAAGGKGSFLTYSLGTAKDGHQLIYKPNLWREAVDSFIKNLKIVPN